MHNFGINIDKLVGLRAEAESRLRNGTAPPNRGWTLSADALAILYKLASNSDSAGEGLKLLHELQAHQVELDLQHEQLEANEQEFAQELARYRSLYECAPVGYFVLTFDGDIVETNFEGARLFENTQEELLGNRFDTYVAADCRLTLHDLLGTLRTKGGPGSCKVHSSGGANDSCVLKINASVCPSGEAVLMVISEYN